MAEMVRERQGVVDKEERHDLLSRLLEANDLDLNLDLETMSEDEIISMLHISSNSVDLVTNVSQAIFTSSLLLDMRFVACTSFRVFIRI